MRQGPTTTKIIKLLKWGNFICKLYFYVFGVFKPRKGKNVMVHKFAQKRVFRWNAAVRYNKFAMPKSDEQPVRRAQEPQQIVENQKKKSENISNPLLKFVSGYDSP